MGRDALLNATGDHTALPLLISIAVAGDIIPNLIIGDNTIRGFVVRVICLQTLQGAATDLTTLGRVTATGSGSTTNPILPFLVISILTQGLHDADPRLHIHASPKLSAGHLDSGLPLVMKTGSRCSRGPDCEYGIDQGISTAAQEQSHVIFGPSTFSGTGRHWLEHFCSLFSSVQTAHQGAFVTSKAPA